MTVHPRMQKRFGVRFDWGPVAAAALADPQGVLVIVDVLSFTTTVTVAVERGTAVYPAPWRDDRAARRAAEVGAALAVGRNATTSEQPWSLSPASLLHAPGPEKLVLPSPNGSNIASQAGSTTVAGCLRNAGAVAARLARRYGTAKAPITIIAAGERWADESLRPALEDLLGAGALISALAREGALSLSPEASAARAVFEATLSIPEALRGSASGLELREMGFGEDVDIAAEQDVSDVVPVLVAGAFRDAHPT